MTALPERQVLVGMVGEAQRAGARLAVACSEVGMSVRTYERWVWDGEVRADARPAAERPASTHKLTEAEREPSHCMAPTYPTLACPRVGSVYLRA